MKSPSRQGGALRVPLPCGGPGRHREPRRDPSARSTRRREMRRSRSTRPDAMRPRGTRSCSCTKAARIGRTGSARQDPGRILIVPDICTVLDVSANARATRPAGLLPPPAGTYGCHGADGGHGPSISCFLPRHGGRGSLHVGGGVGFRLKRPRLTFRVVDSADADVRSRIRIESCSCDPQHRPP